MQNRVLVIITLVLLSITCFGKAHILDTLLSDKNWKIVRSYKDSVKLYKKQLPERKLNAYRVKKLTSIKTDIILRIFEDIQNYEDVLKSASKIDFEFIKQSQDSLFGYQYINVPLVKNRHFLYKMIKHSSSDKYTHWVHLDKNRFPNFIKNKRDSAGNPIYAKSGVGVFKVEPRSDQQNQVAYSLYMDPGGNLPNFLINMSNEKGIVNMFRDVLKEAKKMDTQ